MNGRTLERHTGVMGAVQWTRDDGAAVTWYGPCSALYLSVEHIFTRVDAEWSDIDHDCGRYLTEPMARKAAARVLEYPAA